MMRHSKKILALAAAMAVSSASLAFAMPGDVGKCLDSSVSSEPAVISDAWWNDSVASWNYTGKCDHFEVQLFRWSRQKLPSLLSLTLSKPWQMREIIPSRFAL